ncbi:hypothetical protein NP493_954g00077 [Ridgeia piscesae]|uniref:EGF-like domain-containing protein n=1 Tax=Ridgeia piscesae TaxID=27915 RepID=A0AAD9KJU7_RIDPI|nr:hypothetical protein NP493_954g00077 [Ridgeia piscesae]
MTIRRRRPGRGGLGGSKCDSGPCKNGGRCDDSEDPYDWGFYCICKRGFGGRLCQVSDPCRTNPCPPRAVRCIRSITRDSGRFCYDDAWNLVEP